MARFVHRLSSPLAAVQAFWAVLDLQAQTAVIPLTTTKPLTPLSPQGRVQQGGTFDGVTNFGPWQLHDPMTVEELTAPEDGGRCFARIQKSGKVVLGWVLVEAENLPEGGSRLTWEQEIRIVGISKVADPLVGVGGKIAYGLALRQLLSRALKA